MQYIQAICPPCGAWSGFEEKSQIDWVPLLELLLDQAHLKKCNILQDEFRKVFCPSSNYSFFNPPWTSVSLLIPPMFVLNSWDIRQVMPLWCQDISAGFLSGPGNQLNCYGWPKWVHQWLGGSWLKLDKKSSGSPGRGFVKHCPPWREKCRWSRSLGVVSAVQQSNPLVPQNGHEDLPSMEHTNC